MAAVQLTPSDPTMAMNRKTGFILLALIELFNIGNSPHYGKYFMVCCLESCVLQPLSHTLVRPIV